MCVLYERVIGSVAAFRGMSQHCPCIDCDIRVRYHVCGMRREKNTLLLGLHARRCLCVLYRFFARRAMQQCLLRALKFRYRFHHSAMLNRKFHF